MKLFYIFVFLIIVSSCAPRQRSKETEVNLQDSSEVFLFSNLIVEYIRDQRWRQMLHHIHPVKGITFSPHSSIDTNIAVNMRPGGPEVFWTDTTNSFLWGYEPESNEPIRMNFREYYEKHLYPVNFRDANKKGFNQRIGLSNIENNIKEIFPEAVFTEYYFTCSEPIKGSECWRSLRVVVEEYEGNMYMVALVNDRNISK